MLVKFLTGAKGREVNAAIMAESLLRGYTIKMDGPFVFIEFAEWSAFCSVAYHVYCELSRDAHGALISQRMPVSVYVDGRGWFSTAVWCDVPGKCLRYVSLH